MWENIKKTIITVLAVLGALFLLILIIPFDDEDEEDTESGTVTETVVDHDTDDNVINAGQANAENGDTGEAPAQSNEGSALSAQDDEPVVIVSEEYASGSEPETAVEASSGSSDGSDTVSVNIPSDELSKGRLKFKTTTLDGKMIDQDVFSDYDLTIVHVWGTYCTDCIEEMGEYAGLYDSLPDNVNLIGVIIDVYDGIDNNVSTANDIMDDARAEFVNLRNSDDVYEIVEGIRYIPTTFFVDSEGHVVGRAIEGAPVDATRERLDEYIG